MESIPPKLFFASEPHSHVLTDPVMDLLFRLVCRVLPLSLASNVSGGSSSVPALSGADSDVRFQVGLSESDHTGSTAMPGTNTVPISVSYIHIHISRPFHSHSCQGTSCRKEWTGTCELSRSQFTTVTDVQGIQCTTTFPTPVKRLRFKLHHLDN